MALTKVTGELIDIGDLDLSDVGTISLDAIQGDADANTSITFSGSDVITIATGGSGRLTIGDGALSPVTNNQIDLGTASLEFKNAFFDGTVTADAFAGPLTGNVTGNASGTALTVTQAAQSAITSLGTLTTLTVDDITINGSTISDGADLTIDAGGDIYIDADGGDIVFKDGGTDFGEFSSASNHLNIKSSISDADIKFKGNDGGSAITALTLDMSDAGTAKFNNKVQIGSPTTDGLLAIKGTGAYFDADSATNNNAGMRLYENGTFKWQLYNDGDASDNYTIDSAAGTKVSITQAGNVGIGAASPGSSHAKANLLVVGSGAAGGIGLYNGANDGGYYFSRDNANNTDAYDGGMSYDGSRNLKFHTNAGSTRMTINGSGNVGIGTSSPSADTGVARFLQIGSSSDAHSGLVLEDNSGQWEIQNNGGMTWFYDGTSKMALTTGGDATHYGALNVNTTVGDGSESRFNVNPGGAGDNCTVAIKQDDASTVGVYLQGDGASWFTGGINPGSGDTTAANVLDDYEEGTFTPTYTVAGGGSAGTVTGTNTGFYTKVGRMVTVAVQSHYVPTSGTVPTWYLITLPFAVGSLGGQAGNGSGQEVAQTGVSVFISVANGASTAVIKATNNAAPPANAYFNFGFTYQTA